MNPYLFTIAASILLLLFCSLTYCYFYQRENRLIDRLTHMIDLAQDGAFARNKISEEKLSALENRLKRYMDDSLLEQENQKKQKEIIQKLISDISHQTLTPIANLKIYTELLIEETAGKQLASEKDTGSLSEIAHTIQEQTEKLDFQIQSLVKLSRMESGMVTMQPRQNDIGTLFHSLNREFSEKAGSKNIKLSFPDTDLTAVFDMKWTLEAIGNIIDNAIKYTPSGGKVTVSTEAYSFFIKITIADNGIGIAPEEYPRIFTRFYRSFEAADKPGIGVGLYLSREFIQAQKGYIKVTSQKGCGCVFSVFLPITPSEQKSELCSAPPHH